MKDIKAILYKSNTGTAKRYAEALGAKVGLSVYEFNDCKTKINKGDNVFYIGCVNAAIIRGFKAARKRYNAIGVAAVGMGAAEQVHSSIVETNKIGVLPYFYLRGGMDRSKLKGFNKFVINLLIKSLSAAKAKDPDKFESDEMLDIMVNGKDMYDEKFLDPIVEFLSV